MSIRKTKSSSDGFRINQPDGSSKEVRKTGKIFQSLLSDLGGQEVESLEVSPLITTNRAVLTEIAHKFNLENSEENKTAIKQSAEQLVLSQFSEKLANSKTGKKAHVVVSEYLANDKAMSSKILRVLKRLK